MNVSGVIFSPLEPKKQRSQKIIIIIITPDLMLVYCRFDSLPGDFYSTWNGFYSKTNIIHRSFPATEKDLIERLLVQV